MQAIILAAGMGKRLGELTSDNTKCMIKVAGTTLIDRLLTQLSTLKLNKVIIVTGFKGKELRDYIGNRYNEQIKLEYIHNSIYDKTNNIYSLSLAKKHMEEDDTLLIESDLIFEDSIFRLITENPYPNLALVAKYEPWMDGTMVRIDTDNNVVNFVPKKAFLFQDIDLYYKTVNIYKFSKEFSRNSYVPFLEAYTKALGNNEYYEQVLRVITLLDKTELKALPLSGEKWYEIDDIQDLDIAETLFTSGENKLSMFQKRYGGYWRYASMVDFCYLVNPFFPSYRLKEELKANFEALLTQYPSGLSVNNLLAGKYFGVNSKYICVGNGAAELIKSLMGHLTGKIGTVFPTFEEYPNRKKSEEIVALYPNNKDFSYSIDDIISFFSKNRVETLLIINPDNPSGNFIPLKDLFKLIEWVKQEKIRIIIDESFVDFSENSIENTLLKNEILIANEHLIVIKSISKSYGVPGLRLGVLATTDNVLMEKIRKDVSIWNINSFAEFYMQIFGKYEKDYIHACHLFIEERKRFFSELKRVDYLRVIPSQANYFLCEVTARFTPIKLSEILLDKFNILIKDCTTKTSRQGGNYIRIAIRDKKDNDALVKALLTI